MSDVTNTRNDRWRDPALFLSEVVCAVKTRCGSSYPVLLKVSGAEDHPQGLTPGKVAAILNRLPKDSIQAVEVSYGTMGYALNIMRGQWPVKAALKVNPLFNERSAIALFIWKRFCMQRYLKHLLPFSAHYNAAVAAEIKARTALPVIVTGGIRKMKDIDYCLNESKLNAVSLCRPLISDPEFVVRLQADRTHDSNCTNCNLCAIHCDSLNPTVCYRNKTS
jgi:2,4-dienoyl-CoA reductase-like NADH-dependent reductase (Old Yellow Enzyme family)